jgi:hypothetical protein
LISEEEKGAKGPSLRPPPLTTRRRRPEVSSTANYERNAIIVGVVHTQSKLSKGEQLRRAPGLFNGSIHEPSLTISAVPKERKKKSEFKYTRKEEEGKNTSFIGRRSTSLYFSPYYYYYFWTTLKIYSASACY